MSELTRTSSTRSAWRQVCLVLLVAGLAACSSSSGPVDAGPVSVAISQNNASTQTIQLPNGSGPVTGTLILPPVQTPAGATGDLTLEVLSGSNVSFATALTASPQTRAERTSALTIPGGPFFLEMTLTAPFTFTLPTVPALNLNLGSLGAGNPNGSYTLVVVAGSAAPQSFVLMATNDSVSFPGAPGPVTIDAGTELAFGLEPTPPPTINSFVATPSTLPMDGGTVTLAWDVTGATSLSINQGVGAVTPPTTGSTTTTVTASTTYTLTATNTAGSVSANTAACVAGPVTIAITSPTSYTSCGAPFVTTISMTNDSCQVVTTSVIGFTSTYTGTGTCGFSGPGAYTSANAMLPVSVNPGTTATVFDLENGGTGCCATSPCTISCMDTLQWTLTTNIGAISGVSQPFTVSKSNCSNDTCG